MMCEAIVPECILLLVYGPATSAAIQIYLFEDLVALGIPLVNGGSPVFQKATGSVRELSLYFSNDADCDFIGRFSPNIQPNRRMYAMQIIG